MIGFWTLMIFGALCIIGCCGYWIYYGYSEERGGHIAAGILVGLALLGGMIWGGSAWYNSEPGQRAQKSYQSEYNGGLTRKVTVCDINGKVIREYVGKFDVDEKDDNCIMFDDEKGKRHLIYYTTGTVFVDEVDD